jgi:hypothetical protein
MHYRYTLARTFIRPRYQASLFIYIHSVSGPRTVTMEPAGAMEVRTAIYDKSYEKPRAIDGEDNLALVPLQRVEPRGD